uniref:glutathione transferase n=1 Tax=Trichuris muris TaxID=70415 RepID=A0A5S6QZH7_TRIMR
MEFSKPFRKKPQSGVNNADQIGEDQNHKREEKEERKENNEEPNSEKQERSNFWAIKTTDVITASDLALTDSIDTNWTDVKNLHIRCQSSTRLKRWTRLICSERQPEGDNGVSFSEMAGQLKLAYFDVKGLGEMIRITLRDNKIDFTDELVARDDWPKLKPQMAFGQLPCLYDGGKQIVQSGAIMRHLARRYDLYGSPDEMDWVDQLYDQGKDILTKLNQMIYREYEKKDSFIKTTLPEELEKIEKRIKGRQFFVGNKPTIVDYSIFSLLEQILALEPHSLDHFPSLKAFHDNFASRPNLKPYLHSSEYKSRPFTASGKL